jgi:hypothetical protein
MKITGSAYKSANGRHYYLPLNRRLFTSDGHRQILYALLVFLIRRLTPVSFREFTSRSFTC